MLDAALRKSARSFHWQSLYRASKENQGIHLFENISNFSEIQVRFLYYLKLYNMLLDELNQKEWNNLFKQTIEDDFLCDCFLVYREKKLEFKLNKMKKEEKASESKSKKGGDKGTYYPIYKGNKK